MDFQDEAGGGQGVEGVRVKCLTLNLSAQPHHHSLDVNMAHKNRE